MDKVSSKKEGKKEIRSKRLLTEAFFQLLKQHPGKAITVKELCDHAGYARQTFYAHFDQIEDVPYNHYKRNWLDENFESYIAHINKSRIEKIPTRNSLHMLVKASFSYWAEQVETYKLLKSIELERFLTRLFEEGLRLMYGVMYPNQDMSTNSISEKCIIRGHAQLAYVIYDIWAYSGREMDADEIASIILKVIDGNSVLG